MKIGALHPRPSTVVPRRSADFLPLKRDGLGGLSSPARFTGSLREISCPSPRTLSPFLPPSRRRYGRTGRHRARGTCFWVMIILTLLGSASAFAQKGDRAGE